MLKAKLTKAFGKGYAISKTKVKLKFVTFKKFI